MGIGRATGDNRALEAARQAVASPLLEINIAGAQGILFNITGSSNLTLWEVTEAAEEIRAAADPEANIIFGTSFNERLGDEVMITVIATGFDGRRRTETARAAAADRHGSGVEPALGWLVGRQRHAGPGPRLPRGARAPAHGHRDRRARPRRGGDRPRPLRALSPRPSRRAAHRRTTRTTSRSRASCARGAEPIVAGHPCCGPRPRRGRGVPARPRERRRTGSPRRRSGLDATRAT